MSDPPESGRAQATLVALAAALVALTAAVGLALVLADGALAGAEREPGERRAAVAATDRLVAAHGPVARRAGVLNASALADLSVERVVDLVPPLRGTSFRVRLGDRTLLERGDPTGGTTFRRLVLVSRETPRTRSVHLDGTGVTLPRRTDRVRLDFANASVETVRANGRVVLHRPGGIRDVATVAVSRFETLRLGFDGNASGELGVTYFPERTWKSRLAVTVDA